MDNVANAYRYALIAYLHIILDLLKRNSKDDSRLLQCQRIRNLLPKTKDEAISSCLWDISHVPEGSHSAIGLAPLLFIVAAETRNETEFATASDRLQRVAKMSNLGNLTTAKELLDKVKQSNATDWRRILKSSKWDLIVS